MELFKIRFPNMFYAIREDRVTIIKNNTNRTKEKLNWVMLKKLHKIWYHYILITMCTLQWIFKKSNCLSWEWFPLKSDIISTSFLKNKVEKNMKNLRKINMMRKSLVFTDNQIEKKTQQIRDICLCKKFCPLYVQVLALFSRNNIFF